MTQEQQKQVEVIAVYDGKEIRPNFYKDGILKDGYLPYYNSDNWIMSVARKVMRELEHFIFTDNIGEEHLTNAVDLRNDLKFTAFQSTIDIFNSVYRLIVFLNTLKSTK